MRPGNVDDTKGNKAVTASFASLLSLLLSLLIEGAVWWIELWVAIEQTESRHLVKGSENLVQAIAGISRCCDDQVEAKIGILRWRAVTWRDDLSE